MTAFGDGFVFQSGVSFWTSDGTEQGTKTVHEGPFLYPSNLTVSDDHFYFTHPDSSESISVWASDGTNEGTSLFVELDEFRGMADLNDSLIVMSRDRLWINDPEQQQLALLHNSSSTTRSSFSSPWEAGSRVELNGELLFSADEGDHHYLWKSNGTQAGTSRVSDVTIAWQNSLVKVDSNVFFIGHVGEPEGRTPPLGLWRTNGTADGTRLIKDIGNGPAFRGTFPPDVLFKLNGILFFNAYGPNSEGRELWKSDGTEEGTVLVKDIDPGSNSSSPANFLEFNDELYFTAEDEQTGSQVWKSDGTAEGTTRLTNIEADWFSAIGYRSRDTSDICCIRAHYNTFTAVDESLFFASGNALWKTDGTEIGTVQVHNGNGRENFSPSSLIEMNGTLYFVDGWGGVTVDKITGDGQLWRSDGTTDGTYQVKQIGEVDSRLIGIQELVDVNGLIYFSAHDGENGRELWRSDGTEAGTWMVKDIWAGSPGSHPEDLSEVNGTLYFSALSGAGGRQLWTSDGTLEGTVPIENQGSRPRGLLPSTIRFSTPLQRRKRVRSFGSFTPHGQLAMSTETAYSTRRIL